jgi:hypothetical protein
MWPVFQMLTSGFTTGTQLPRRKKKYCSYIIIVENIPMPVIFMAIKNTNVRIMYSKANNGNNA